MHQQQQQQQREIERHEMFHHHHQVRSAAVRDTNTSGSTTVVGGGPGSAGSSNGDSAETAYADINSLYSCGNASKSFEYLIVYYFFACGGSALREGESISPAITLRTHCG